MFWQFQPLSAIFCHFFQKMARAKNWDRFLATLVYFSSCALLLSAFGPISLSDQFGAFVTKRGFFHKFGFLGLHFWQFRRISSGHTLLWHHDANSGPGGVKKNYAAVFSFEALAVRRRTTLLLFSFEAKFQDIFSNFSPLRDHKNWTKGLRRPRRVTGDFSTINTVR